ncbi:cytochrome c oxidase subunit II [Bradyrhizobium sp. NAS80.1]|uniref:cytochrome C oxidase subunit II n=1 Tax=Bradyrhizobium sp. NAS80.1 TaxID=1680159 RepID=UPI00095EE920|nr:cytochrome C oxidase subunit II [Bradyrhizobium sp. NAS80.1]OKO82286.1 cytochrome c oxidase subunit II [Bradyrhizobium sp. NAS80.1]
MTNIDHESQGEEVAVRAERRWAILATVAIVVIVGLAAITGITHQVMPQSGVELVDPNTLHISGEFTEANLGSALESDGSVTVRVIGLQYSFTPQCMLVPADTNVTFRATSADVVHGFIVTGSNINTMLVPGYVSIQTTRFSTPGERLMPCHEYCGLGHEGMWARVRVIDRDEFLKLPSQKNRVTCD